MATANFEITSYTIKVSREMNGSAAGLALKIPAYIECAGGAHRITIYVLDDTSPIPPNTFDTVRRWGNIYIPRWQFEWFRDLLRGEKPVYGYLNSDTPKWNSVYTGSEPVGELEV